MKLAISNIAWDDSDAEYCYNKMLEYGFTGLEIAPTKFSMDPYINLGRAGEIRDQIHRDYGFDIVSMQSLLFGTNGLSLFESATQRDLLKEYLKKAIIYAKIMNCPVLVFGNPKNRIMQDTVRDYAVALDFFKELGDFAEVNGTCLCIEPNPKEYGTNFINNLQEAELLVKEVSSNGFAMIVDTSTMLINGDNLAPLSNIIKHNLVKHIHISTPFLKPLNQEYPSYEIWFKDFVEQIRQTDYAGFCSIEMVNANCSDVDESLSILSDLVNS